MRRLLLVLVALCLPALASAQSTDNFNRANGTLGVTWTTQAGACGIVSNQAYGTTANADNICFYNNASFANNQYSKTTVATATDGWAGVTVRASSTGVSMNAYVFYAATAGRTSELWAVVAGSWSLISNSGFGTFAATDIVEIDASSSSIFVKRNGAQVGSTHSNGSLSSGSPGLAWYTPTTTTDAQSDTWEGGDIAAAGNTYYVSLTGNNGSAGTSTGTAWRDISYGVAQLSAGDSLCIGAGTWTGTAQVIDSQTFTVPSGTSTGWGTTNTGAISIGACGSDDNTTVIIKPPDSVNVVRLTTGAPSYLILHDVALDGSLTSDPGDPIVASRPEMIYISGSAHHFRFQRLDIGPCMNDCMATSLSNAPDNTWHTYYELVNSKIHGAGQATGDWVVSHGGPGINTGYLIYSQTDGNLLDGNDWYSTNAFAINVYGSDNIIRNNRVHAWGLRNTSSAGTSTAINIGSSAHPVNSERNQVYNNLVYNASNAPGNNGIVIYTNSVDTVVANNSVYDVAGLGFFGQFYLTGNILRNNIFYSNGTNICDFGGGGTCASGTITQDHNLTSNPSFTNAGSGDFTISCPASAACDAGSSTGLTSIVTTDITGGLRPFNSVYDIGAYEFGSSADTTSPTVTITAPTSSTSYSIGATPLTTLAGTCSDDIAVSSVHWSNSAGGSGTATGTTSWSVASIVLSAGAQTITVTCTDTSSNDGTDTLIVTLSVNGAPALLRMPKMRKR